MTQRVVIVGAGHAGGTAAALLRQHWYTGEVVLIGDEPVGPYHRPPLSKSLRKGDLEQPLQPEAFYGEQGIELRTHTRVTAIDRDARTVALHNGERLGYGHLIIATGSRARRLEVPGIDLEHVHELRTVTDARVLQEVLEPGCRLAIVGGGWIGLEVAASAVDAGVDVTVIEREERLLARVASPELSQRLTEAHAQHGTAIITGAQVTGLVAGPDGAVAGVGLADGRTIACDSALVGIGGVADDELARAAGLPCADGVIVDARAATSDPHVLAIGDVTRRPLAGHDGLVRLESIPSAVEQARQAVATILDAASPPEEVPWFWSDQFDLKLQLAGVPIGADARVVRDDPASNRFVVFHLRGEQLIGVEAVSAASEFVSGRQLIRDQAPVDPARLADPAVALVAAAEPAPAEAEPDGAPIDLPGPGGVAGQPRVTYVLHTGEVRCVDVPAGLTVMDGSVRNNLPGIIAECGGMCSCGTCHVVVGEQWADRLPDLEYEEEDLLEFLEGRRPTSRLSCQLVLTDELDGLVVHVPDFDK